jgi:hypothetical protein
MEIVGVRVESAVALNSLFVSETDNDKPLTETSLLADVDGETEASRVCVVIVTTLWVTVVTD